MLSVIILSGAVRGRARLRVGGLRRQPELALLLQDRLGSDDRIYEVRASALTGNVLVLFDAGTPRLGPGPVFDHRGLHPDFAEVECPEHRHRPVGAAR
jgi:hypothetical protein